MIIVIELSDKTG